MKRLELTEDHLTGLKDIDSQHKQLFDLANSVLFAGEGAPAVDVFRQALVFLARYVEYHFASEEFAMSAQGFAGLKHHQTHHRHFRAEVAEFLRRAKSEGPTQELQTRLHFMVRDWFTYHIEYLDKKLAKFLKEEAEGIGLPSLETLRGWKTTLADVEQIQVVPVEGMLSASELKARGKRGR